MNLLNKANEVTNKENKIKKSVRLSVREWLETVVIGLNLCPFAKQELLDERIRFAVSDAPTEEQLLASLGAELALLDKHPEIETTLLIHPNVLGSFDDYNQFLAEAEALLVRMSYQGIYQIASFHPDYQFAGSHPDDAENYTNRSPYPILHLLREASLERAIASHPHPEQIPEDNIALMETMGVVKLKHLLQTCLDRS